MNQLLAAIVIGALTLCHGPVFAQEKKSEPAKEEATKADVKKAKKDELKKEEGKKKVKKGGC